MVNVNMNVTSETLLVPPEDGSIRGLEVKSQCYVIVLEVLVLLALWLTALLGNILIVLVILRSKRVQSTTNFFVISLACSDMALVLLSCPLVCARIIWQEWPTGHVSCRIARFVQFTSMSTTSFVLVAICMDRYYTVIYPLRFKITRGTAKRMVITAWVTSALISSLCIFFFNQVEVRQDRTNPDIVHYICPTFIPSDHWSSVLYAGLCIVSQFLCPVFIVTIGYSRIVFHILATRGRARRSRMTCNSSLVPRTKVKMVRMLMGMSISTLLLFTPFYTTQAVYGLSFRTFLSSDVFVASFWFVVASAAIKPVVYACKNSNFWRGCKEVLCMSAMRCYRLNAYTITNASKVSKRNYVGVVDLSRDRVSISIDSPGDPFNRSRQLDEKTVWPINGCTPSTSL